MKRAVFKVDWKTIPSDIRLPASIDIGQRTTVFFARQLPSVEV